MIAIDASRNRSGGAVAHMIGLLGEAEPQKYGISEVHVWSYTALLNKLPKKSWLVCHNPPALEKNILQQLYWQYWQFPKELRQVGCDVVLNTDAGTINTFKPAVTMSRDMLSYEPGETRRYGLSRARLRLWLLRYMQNHSLRTATGAIFLTKYAADVIQRSCGLLKEFNVIPHGVKEGFRNVAPPENLLSKDQPVKCIYVSNSAPYKHQWHVVRAISQLDAEGYDVSITLVGGGTGAAQKKLELAMQESDPAGRLVTQLPFLPSDKLPALLQDADIFVFASSCENMPNTLVEGMAAGLPIACSNRGPMPEVLRDGGVYFDPENSQSIAGAIRQIINDQTLRTNITLLSQRYAEQFSWKRCADETFAYMAKIHEAYSK